MSTRFSRAAFGMAVATAIGGLGTNAGAGDDSAAVGLDDLMARLGGDTPTGANVVVAQAEAGDSFYPDTGHAEFTGKTFVEHSGSSSSSTHATVVGRNFYGLDTSIAPGVSTIHLYSAGGLLTGNLLRTGSGTPLVPPSGLEIINNSWIAAFQTVALNNDANRRADWYTTQHEILWVNGTNNGGDPQPLMAYMFDGCTVGVQDGDHTWGTVPSGYDGVGRMYPDIVAPGSVTSYATPVVAAGVALMVETVETDPDLSKNPNANETETLKAVMLAGATKDFLGQGHTWDNDVVTSGPDRGVAPQPYDPIYGVGMVNVDRSHMILTGQEQEGSTTVPMSPNASYAGWDFDNYLQNQSRYFYFDVPELAEEVSIAAAWHRLVTPTFNAWTLQDLDMTLWGVDGNGNLESIVGDAGLGVFGGGNVVSESSTMNVEYLHITDLEPGDYVLEVTRANSSAASIQVAVAWLFPEVEAPPCPCDFDGDNDVDVDDLLAVLGAWGTSDSGDCTGDGQTNVDDLLAVLGDWGDC